MRNLKRSYGTPIDESDQMRAKTLAVAAVAVLAVAGCGATTSTSTAGSAENAPAVAWAACLRSHGVPNFPDPLPGHKAQFPDSSASILDSRSPAVLAAERACRQQHAAIIGSGAGPSANRTSAFLEYARCMRAHGVPTYPDPTYARNGRPVITDLAGAGIDTRSPAFIGAARACNGHGIPVDQGGIER